MSDKIKEEKGVVVDFMERLQQKEDKRAQEDLEAFLNMEEVDMVGEDINLERTLIPAYEAFIESLEDDAVGILTITFRDDGKPTLIHGGELDLLDCVGALELMKNDIIAQPKMRFIQYDNSFEED